MPYQAGARLGSESASKLGHLDIAKSEFVRSLLEKFEYPDKSRPADEKMWQPATAGEEHLPTVIAVDGSLQIIQSDAQPLRTLAFIKTALVRIDKREMEKIDPVMPHPVHLKALMSKCALQTSTVLPLRNVSYEGLTNVDVVRTIVRDSLKTQLDGIAYDTLKWLLFRLWSHERSSSPNFMCPHCGKDTQGLPFGQDESTCSNCNEAVWLIDVIGFHLEMGEDDAPDSLASAYMLVHETLMLFSVVRHFLSIGDKTSLSNILLIKDGPLTLRSQYSKMVPSIRLLFEYLRDNGVTLHMIGQEKTGRFVDHLAVISKFAPPLQKNDPSHFAVLSHEYIRRQVDHASERSNPYGFRTNYGEKVFVKLDPYHSMVLSVPTGQYLNSPERPNGPNDLIGWPRILATLPSLMSYQHEGALFPISLANGVASLSSYPSAAVLKLLAGL